MATNTERFGFTLPSGQDPASIIPLNLNTQNIEKYLGMTQDMLAPLYDATEGTYEVDDIVTHDSILYKCIEAVETPEAFDETKWVETTAVSEGGGGAGAIEKTQAEYNELTPAQKTNGAIYMVQDDGTGDYEYHTNQAETIVVRINRTTSEIEWFFVDYTFTGGSVEQIPSELTAYLPSSTISGVAYDTSLETEMGYVAINNQGGFGLYPTDYSREIAGTVKCLLKNTDGTEQANTYTDPYEGTGDAVNKIYFMGTEYANTNGGSGGGSQELYSYEATITTSQYGWWEVEDKDGNVLDVDKYELLTVTPIVDNTTWTGAWDGAFYIQEISDNKAYTVTFVNINDGGYIRTSRTWDVKVVYRDKSASGRGGGSSSVNYSTDEQDTGIKWIDGSSIYQRTYILSTPISLSERNEVSVDLGSSGTNINLIIDAQVYRMAASQYGPCVAYMMTRKVPNSSNIMIYSYVNVSDINIITLRYTKVVS